MAFSTISSAEKKKVGDCLAVSRFIYIFAHRKDNELWENYLL
jgi:hypothetical protein